MAATGAWNEEPVWDQRVAGASSTKSGSHKTRRWSKGDSNSWSHPERQRSEGATIGFRVG
jgi:hypothetical protein